jgi:hypothetical protein
MASETRPQHASPFSIFDTFESAHFPPNHFSASLSRCTPMFTTLLLLAHSPGLNPAQDPKQTLATCTYQACSRYHSLSAQLFCNHLQSPLHSVHMPCSMVVGIFWTLRFCQDAAHKGPIICSVSQDTIALQDLHASSSTLPVSLNFTINIIH